MMKNKKGVELGMNMIVLAVIALAVLIVLLLTFTGKFGLFSSELNKCGSIGGSCVKDKASCDGRVVGGEEMCKTETNKVCCVSSISLFDKKDSSE